MDVQSSSRHLVEIDLTQESGDDTDFTAEEEDTEEEDDIKMEDVSSQVAASTSTKPAADDQTEPQVCIAIEEMDEEDDDESTGSSDSIDDLIDDGQSSKQTTPDPDEPSTSKPDTSTRVHQDESGKGARFIKYNEGVESEESSSRSYVSDSWSELGDDDQRQESAEAQEAVIDEHFKEALAALRANKRDKSMRILLNILADPIVSKEFQVDEWTHFDWTSARTKTSNQRASNLAKIFFSTNVAIAELVENPVPFYMQALSVRPELSELWYECGKAAAKLSDWSTAEFCFKQCNKDDFRAWESLLLLHFLQQNFHECFIYLKKIFAQCKDHRLAHYIRFHISQSAAIWKEFCDNKFLGENFEKVLDAKVDKQIGDKIANFTSKSSNNLEDARLNPFVEILTQVEVYAPLRLRLDMDMKMEQLGSLICDAFDRIETFSLISEQSIIVEEKEDELNLLMSADDEMSDVAQTTPQLETSNEPSKSLQDDDAVLSQDLLKCVEEVVDDMLDSIVDETEYFRTYFSPKDPPQASLQKNKSRKKFQSSTEKNSRKLRRQFTQDINGNDKDDTPLCADDSVRCRRSTRFVEDLDISQFSIAETEGDTNKSDLLRLMGVPRTLEAPPSPLSKRLSMGTAKNCLNSSMDCLNSELLPLPSVKELAEKWVENSEIGIQQCLFGFLKWIAVDLQDNSFRSITSAEAEVYRQVYIRWSDTFVSALKNVSTTNIAWDDMCIHLLAAELGSPRALSILQTYFATRQAVGGTSAKDDVEPQKSVSSSSIQTPKNSICVLEKVDVSSLTAISQQSAFPASDMKMMADLLNRMLEEKNANSSSGAINATIQRLQRHSINEKTSALEEAMDQSSVKSNSPHPSPNLSLQRMVEIRYQWLIAQLKPEEIGLPSEGNIAFLHRYINMLELVALMKDGERVQSHANFGNGCISLLNVSGLLYEEWRLFNAKQINQLKESEQYEELQYALLHHFDWSEASEEVQIDQLFLLVQCALKTDDLALAVEYLLTILKRLHQKCLPKREAKKALKRGLSYFQKDIDLAKLSDSLVCGLGELLADMVSSEQFYSSTTLWIICHRIAKHREGDLNESDLVQFYEETSARQDQDENCLPTKALMVLMKAHEALGEAQKCDQEEGRFLRFFLDELAETMSLPAVKSAIASDRKYLAIVENVQVEVYQCINCAFGESKSLRKYDDHASQCKWRADWNLAKTILPLLLPQPLPLVYSLEKVSPDLVDVISRIFKFVLEVEPTLEAQLLDFCKQPPVMELREVTDPDGIALEYAEEYQTDEDPRNILSIQSRQYLCDVSEDRKDQLSLSAKCLYLSSLAQHRNNINTPNQDMMRMIRCCLAIANPYLDSQLQSSVWYMYARNLANEYIMLPSHELVDQVDQFLFPFKMSIYLKQDFCEAHLDIATITYQVRTRIKRFSARSDVEEEKRRKARAKMDGMLLKCRVHFELARKHNDSPAEVPWLSTYFLAKIAEKLGEAPEKICKLYHESALALEQEGYLYPQKIHRSKQINFEPLEIHYKLHSYALKKVNEWKNMNKFQLKSSLHSSLSTLHTLSAYLQLFTRHGVETKTARPDLFMEEPNYFTTPMHHQQSTKNSLATDVLATVDNLVDAVSQQLQIQSTCMYAFETIMAKFPHYKACYRMAKLAFVKGDYKACADLLFDRLLLPVTGTAAAKKRGNTTVPPINSSTSLFENVVEISRADIERSGSYAYHIHKIFNLAIISTYKCNDLGRLVLLLSSLATIRNEEQAPDKMGREDIRGLQTKCSNAITKIAPLPKMSTDKLLHNCSLLQDLLRKLKKENNEYVTEIENCLAKCAEKRAVWSNRQQHAEQAARMPQEQEHPTQQLQPAPVEKRNTSPLPLPHATNKIAVITIPETPPRPSTITDHAATATTSASSTSQEHSDLRNVIKQHLLLHRSRKQQHEPAKKAVKRALDGCQTSPDKQQHNGNQSAGGGAPPAKKVTLEVDKNNLSQYFEEVLKRMTPEASAQVVQYIQNPTIDKDEKKRYVLNVLANAGFTMTPSPQKAVNDNAIVATTSFSPTTTDAVCPKPQPQQRPATQTGQQPRKRKVVLMPRDPRLQTSHLNGATTSGVAPASRPPTLPITLQTPSSFSPSLAPIPKPVVANHAPAAAQMSSSSSTLATKPAPITLKPTANQSQPTAITNPNKPKRPRIQAPTKDGQQQHKQNATATKGGVSSSSYASATTYSQQQMSAENIQEYLRLASMLPSSSINEQTLAALREVTKTVAAKAKPVSGRQGSPLIRQPQPSGAANGGLNLSKHNNSGQKPENLVSKPPLQRPLHQPSTSSPFTSPSTHNQQHAQFGRSQVSNSNQHQTHSPLASNKSTSSTTPQHQPSPKPGQSSTSGQPSFHLPHFSSPTSTYNSSPRLSENPPQRLTLPLKQATTSSHKPGRPLDLQAVVRKQKQKTQASQMQKPPLDHTSDNSSSSHINPTSNMQQANLLTQAQLQTHTQALQLEKLQQYLRQQHQQGQQSWMPLLAQQWSQQSSNVPLQSAGTSRKTTPHNGSMEQGLAEIARRFELQKLAFEQRSMKDQAGKRN